MGRDVCDLSAGALRIFEAADTILGSSLSSLCFDGPDGELTKTANAQPAILVTSIALLAASVEAGVLDRRPRFLAGHSLGEYTALVVARSVTFEAGITLVAERGRVMERAGQIDEGTMAAIVGMQASDVERLCQQSGAEVCNYNSPTQIVIGGSPSAVEEACHLAKDEGGRGLPLNVSGAFHTSLMKGAAEDFRRVLKEATIDPPRITVLGNTTALPMVTASDALADLSEQMTLPVMWSQSVEFMAKAGVKTVVEIGPGRALTAILKRSYPDISALSIEGAAALVSPSNV